ncbi:3-oxoacyl-ACP synthase [Winogradskyella bathintestinalis]|uniref:3-oxoacyl-ACP synthase n=1 Tax=Winogradskyella bathintestinalis TaxID=3035208 RepID=A0ABT7ZR79_9FLAO|nr:3-oxoacyl-ACP synthase [Winogradskyella bathintestinalis]MDN3491492.1 3-oxoacyl-ACP synthase [Winogradskyella bathintestinalis]
MSSIKTKLYNQCVEFLEARLTIVNQTISDLQNALQAETKSSAGDKHETGRAMLQLEREKAGNQLAEIEKQKQILQKINPASNYQKVTLGSVVKTTGANYFISISAGKIEVEYNSYFAISAATPIAQLLISKCVNDTVRFRETEFTILDII